jgi:hypothetical protein
VFEGSCSIHLSYRRKKPQLLSILPKVPFAFGKWYRFFLFLIESGGIPAYGRDTDLPLSTLRQVGTTGFEPVTSCSQSKRSSQTEPRPALHYFIIMSKAVLNVSAIRHANIEYLTYLLILLIITHVRIFSIFNWKDKKWRRKALELFTPDIERGA